MGFKLLSIIIPIYNVEKYLEKCLESILSQGVNDKLEVICINDGTKDQSANILRSFKKRYPDIKIFEQKNIGLGATRNKGINLATGKYIMFVDSDDWIIDNTLAELLNILEYREDAIIEYKTLVFHEEKNLYTNYNTFLTRINNFLNGTDYLETQNKILLTAWSKIWKRAFIIKYDLTFTENVFFEDVSFSLPAYLKADKISNIDRFIYCYRLRKGSITKANIDKKFLTDFYNERLFKHLKYKKQFKGLRAKKLINQEIGRILIKSFVFIFKTYLFKKSNIRFLLISLYYSLRYFPYMISILLNKLVNRHQ